eukprot:6463817-Alexandrium_andersonii.AAC.1
MSFARKRSPDKAQIFSSFKALARDTSELNDLLFEHLRRLAQVEWQKHLTSYVPPCVVCRRVKKNRCPQTNEPSAH